MADYLSLRLLIMNTCGFGGTQSNRMRCGNGLASIPASVPYIRNIPMRTGIDIKMLSKEETLVYARSQFIYSDAGRGDSQMKR